MENALSGDMLHILAILVGLFSSALISILIYVWKRQEKKTDGLSKTILSLAKALDDYKLQVTKNHATHNDLKELQNGIYKRLDRHEGKLDDYLKTVNSSIPRNEFEDFKDQIHQRVNSLEQRKMDKPTGAMQ